MSAVIFSTDLVRLLDEGRRCRLPPTNVGVRRVREAPTTRRRGGEDDSAASRQNKNTKHHLLRRSHCRSVLERYRAYLLTARTAQIKVRTTSKKAAAAVLVILSLIFPFASGFNHQSVRHHAAIVAQSSSSSSSSSSLRRSCRRQSSSSRPPLRMSAESEVDRLRAAAAGRNTRPSWGRREAAPPTPRRLPSPPR